MLGQPKRAATTVVAIIAIAFPGVDAMAHSDMDKPLFVAEHGVDTGRCQDPAAPCRTIAYALQRVGKGGQIRVATGYYAVEDVRDLFHLVSGVIDVRGGYSDADDFQQARELATTLIGVPPEYRALLGARGFHVVADRKANNRDVVVETERLIAMQATLQSSLSAAPCVGGQVAGLACQNTELLAHVALGDVSANPAAAADVWGFVDLNTNREYAIVGYQTGTGVFDITDAANPREVGFVDGQASIWRDIKVHQFYNAAAGRWNAYAYITTDNSTDGLFIIDLSGLPHRISRQGYASDFSSAHNVYASNTDGATGVSLTGDTPALIVAGSNNGSGRFRLYSLANAASPAFVTMAGGGSLDYMHDAASIIIRDARKDTQCVNAVDYCDVLFDFHESTIDIWDITNSQSPVRLSSTPYANRGYTHSGWASEDGQYLYVQDEGDEQAFGLQTTLRIFSLSNLASPTLVGIWNGPTNAIDHNGFVRGNRYYMSNYSRGLTILDISNPVAPTVAGRLDTYPFSDSANFVGAWGTYPYFHSGNVAVSDINSGLYIVGDNTLDTSQGSIAFAQASFAAAEGNNVQVTLQRTGGTTGSVGVTLSMVPGTADGADLAGNIGSANWSDGDGTDKIVNIGTLADGAAEGLERMLLNLVAPTGGATLGKARAASIYISDPADIAMLQFDAASIDVVERGFNTAVVNVQRSGSALGAASVDFNVSGGDASSGSDYQGPAGGTLNWADGDANPKWVEYAIADDGSGEGDEFFELTLSGATGGNLGANTVLRVNILDGAGANQAPNSVAGISQTVQSGAIVALNGSGSNDPDGDNLSYQWSQTMGPTVAISNASAVNAAFTAPTVNSDTLLRFQLEVRDPGGLADTSVTSVTVRAQGSGNGFGSGGGGAPGWFVAVLLFAALVRQRQLIRMDAAL